jgi:hypothetical protein
LYFACRYQFVLAFENGYCRDYVTEKLWNAYRRLQIPVVSGGADYTKVSICCHSDVGGGEGVEGEEATFPEYYKLA